MYRKDKTGQWNGTLSYNFTKPVSPKRGIAKTLKVALLLVDEEAAPKTRSEILKMIGVPKQVAEKKGQYSCIFTALNWNNVIVYNKTSKTYVRGTRYAEFMQYTLSLMGKNPTLKKKHQAEYLKVLKATSKALHFMVS